MRFDAFSFAEAGVLTWAIAQSLVALVALALIIYLVLLARRHVRAQERIADALERERGAGPSGRR